MDLLFLELYRMTFISC